MTRQKRKGRIVCRLKVALNNRFLENSMSHDQSSKQITIGEHSDCSELHISFPFIQTPVVVGQQKKRQFPSTVWSVSLEGINNNELNSFAAWQLTIAFISFAKQLSYANLGGVWYR